MENFDDLIKKYTQELELMGQTYGGEAEAIVEKTPYRANGSVSEEVTTDSNKVENAENEAETAAEELKNELLATESEIKELEAALSEESEEDEKEGDYFASFSAAVFSGEGTYPVEGARVVVYRGDKIFAFLDTNENGATERVKLPSYSKESSLEPDSPDKSREYFADVFAEGFTAQKGLLVSAVGGSEILLRVLMVPESERFD